MLNDTEAKKLFKIAGILNIIFAILMIGGAILSIFGLVVTNIGQFSVLVMDVNTSSMISRNYILFGISTILGIILAILYSFSALGFLKLKKWQSVIFPILVPLFILNIILQIIQKDIFPVMDNVMSMFYLGNREILQMLTNFTNSIHYGFKYLSLISALFIFLWLYLFVLVRKKKSMFIN